MESAVDVKVDFAMMKQYRQIAAEIAELEEEREALAEGKVPSSWPMGQRVMGGVAQDVTAELAGKMWDLAQLMAERLNHLIALRAEIERQLSNFGPEEQRMLRLYYVDGLTWEEVAEKVGYSSRHIGRKMRRLWAANDLLGDGAKVIEGGGIGI